MVFAIVLVLIVVASVLFHVLSPWQATAAASNWGSIDAALFITLLITGIFFIAVTLFMALAIIRYRHKEGRRAAYQPENKKLEWWLIGVTSVGIIGLLAPGLVVYHDFVRVPADAHELEVVAQQWQWSFRFPGQDRKLGKSDVKWIGSSNPLGLDPNDPAGQDDVLIRTNQVRLPLDRPVKVLLRSKDVLHNFYVPQIRSKMDMVPGMVSYFWFTPTQLGSYDVLCAEYCGLAHYNMRGNMIIEEPAAFEQWLNNQPTFAQTLRSAAKPSRESVLEQGRQLAQNSGCLACHSLDGSASLGPGWKDLYGRTEQLADGSSVQVDEAYLIESILEPKAKLVQGYPPVMVPYTFKQEELDALLTLIKSLSGATPDEQAPAGAAATPDVLVAQGRQLASSLGCLTCHSVDGKPGVGPTWLGLYGKTQSGADGTPREIDEAYLKESIRDPGAVVAQGFTPVMPAFELTDDELDALVALIKSTAGEGDGTPGAAP
ncbi:MAG: cytochrome c oxidase subunit II [Pseudomonas sp.]|uniref:cytochrome c oxidase subunit II n=1 Tax=Pseudomonas sp. TaxID=306 RepID=UPI00299F3237|nr:cytochrome c oxidase subunit II [Pseudomonas sp.]MDX1723275.1 cytochrome c oxidase subunit II [Pseudomonas sp.]